MKFDQHKYAEVLVDRLLLESFSNERSPYHDDGSAKLTPIDLDRFRGKLRWHIGHSLSERQKQVIKEYLKGRTERQIAIELGITQQVVHIYKHRAIRKLKTLLAV